MHHRIVALAVLVATPALPCSPATDTLEGTVVIEDGEVGVPTRLHVAFSRFGLGGQVAFLSEADAEPGTVEPLVVELSGEGLVGLVTLAPDTRYVLGGTDFPGITFTTGAGEDLERPTAPTVELEVIQYGPAIEGFDSCTSLGFDGGSTRIDVQVTADADVAGAIARDPETGATLAIGTDALTFRSGESDRRLIEVVAVDRAGNESVPVPVSLDFGGPGGCSQGGAAPVVVGLLPLLLRLRRRRHRPGW